MKRETLKRAEKGDRVVGYYHDGSKRRGIIYKTEGEVIQIDFGDIHPRSFNYRCVNLLKPKRVPREFTGRWMKLSDLKTYPDSDVIFRPFSVPGIDFKSYSATVVEKKVKP